MEKDNRQRKLTIEVINGEHVQIETSGTALDITKMTCHAIAGVYDLLKRKDEDYAKSFAFTIKSAVNDGVLFEKKEVIHKLSKSLSNLEKEFDKELKELFKSIGAIEIDEDSDLAKELKKLVKKHEGKK